MAYVARSNDNYTTVLSTSYTHTLPEHESGDLLLLNIVNRDGSSTITTPSGWTEYGTQSQHQSQRLARFYRVATSSSETNPSVTGANGYWAVTCLVVKDADTVNPINTEAIANYTSSLNYTTPAATTTANNCLVVWCSSMNSGRFSSRVGNNDAVYAAYASIDSVAGISFCGLATDYSYQFTAGAVPTPTYYTNNGGLSGQTSVVCINNATGGSNAIIANTAKTDLFVTSYTGPANVTFRAANFLTGLTAINGISMSSLSPNAFNGDKFAGMRGYYQRITGTASTEVWDGALMEFPAPIDVSGGGISIFLATAFFNDLRVGAEGLIFAIVDNLENWAAFRLRTQEDLLVRLFAGNIVLKYGSYQLYDESSTPPNLENIEYLGFFYHRTASTTQSATSNFANVACLNGSTIVGGGVNNPVTPHMFKGILVEPRQVDVVSNQGSGQAVIRGALNIGDGSTPTYADFTGGSLEVAVPNNQTFKVADNDCDITLNASSACTFKMTSCTIATTQKNAFIIDPSTSLSATYDFAGMVLKGFEVSVGADITINDASLAQTRGVTLNSGILSGCTISNSQTTPAVTTNDPANIVNCGFTSAGTGHAIEITATGTFDFDGNTFTGYGADGSTDAAIYNNSGGAVTLNLTAGSDTPTVRNGAGASTTVNAPVAGYTLQLPNIIDGSRYQIFNVTANTELHNAVVSGGSGISHTYNEGTDFTVGDIGRYRVAYQSGTTAKQTLEGTFTFPSGTTTNSLPISQVDQDEYIAFGVDGSTVAEFTWDSGNVQVDINDTDNTTTIQRLGAWYYYFITTATGIDEAFGAITWLALNQIRINSSNVNMTLDNTKATPLLLMGGRLFRDDAATIIAGASNSIQVDYEPVYVAETGTSGLTPTEAAQLASIADVKAKTDAISLTSGNVNANIKAVNDAALQGAGVEGNEWRPA